MMLEKKTLRRSMRTRRDGMDPEERQAASCAICGHILASPLYRQADVLALYSAMGSEVDLSAVARAARAAGKRTVYPLCMAEAGQMEFYVVAAPEALRPGKWGILAPDPACCSRVEAGEIALLLAPCLAVDAAGVRLGYGGGYYDRYIARPDFHGVTLAAAYSVQFTESTPAEPTDRTMDGWVTEAGMILRNGAQKG